MRLISIGRAKSSTIRLDSEYVSAHHAEILLLDNGDIFLTDCGSKQGTFVFGKRIEPGVEVPIRRGDKIEFDDIPLNWARVPVLTLPDPASVKGIYGVGKSTRNRYQLSGESVSRYHATFKEMKNGKWFIQDHSTNGTYINGQRIPADQDVRISAKDQIICGTVPCPNPVTSNPVTRMLLPILGGIAACIALFFGVWALLDVFRSFDPSDATVFVSHQYVIRVDFTDNPVKAKTNKDWYMAYDGYEWKLQLGMENATPMTATGTGFFVSSEGYILTNRHVADWIWGQKKYGDKYADQMKTAVKNYIADMAEEIAELLSYSDDEAYGIALRMLTSPFDLAAEPLNFYIGYTGRNYTYYSEMDVASLVDLSTDDKIDMALLQLNTKKTPEFASWFNLNKAITDIRKLNKKSMYHTVGFPAGLALTKLVDRNSIHSTSGQLHLVQNPGQYTLVFNGDQTVGGQSGSPIFDKRNHLIGILFGGTQVMETTMACPIIHAKDLFGKTIGH